MLEKIEIIEVCLSNDKYKYPLESIKEMVFFPTIHFFEKSKEKILQHYTISLDYYDCFKSYENEIENSIKIEMDVYGESYEYVENQHYNLRLKLKI